MTSSGHDTVRRKDRCAEQKTGLLYEDCRVAKVYFETIAWVNIAPVTTRKLKGYIGSLCGKNIELLYGDCRVAKVCFESIACVLIAPAIARKLKGLIRPLKVV
jgi:hypothetical protein